MKIGIIGSAFVGEHLAKAWTRNGHEVMISSRTPQSNRMSTLIAEVGNNAQAGTIQETVAFSDVQALCLGWDKFDGVGLVDAGDWSGKIVIDVTNRIGAQPAHSTGSAATDLARLLTGAKIVKAFNSIGMEHALDPQFGDHAAMMPIAGDDEDAKQIVSSLVSELGFEVVDAGGLDQAILLEKLAELWISLAFRRGYGRDIAFGLLKK